MGLLAGEYFVHVLLRQKSRTLPYLPPSSLVLYSPQQVALRPILSTTKAEDFKETMLRQEYRSLLEEAVPSARGRSIETSTVCAGRRVLLLIANHECLPKRIRLTVASPHLELEDAQKEATLQIDARAEKLVGLCIRGAGNAVLQGREPAYTIRVIG